MKIEFKTSDIEPGHQWVFVNEILEGEFYYDDKSQSFRYVPTLGNEILLPCTAHDEARKQLIGKLSRIYN